MSKEKYDPKNIRAHANRTYVANKKVYHFGILGTFHGVKSIEGFVPELVAGIEAENLCQVAAFFDATDRSGLYNYVIHNAKKPETGDFLVLVLSEEDSKKGPRIGLRSGLLEAIK